MPLNYNEDAQALRKALNVTFSADPYSLVEVLVKYPNHEITNLSRVYRELFNQHLDVDIKKKTSGDIEDALELFLMPLPAMEARVLNRAFKGLGTDEEVVIELLCLRTDEQLRAIAQAYQDQYSQTLADRLAEELSGKEEKLFASLVRASRQDGKDNEVEAHATRLYEAAEKRLVGNDNKVFVDFLTNFSRGYVDKVALAYKRKYSKPLHVAIEREFSGVFQKALMALSTPIVNYYANAFLVNFQRLNMDEMKLVRMMIARHDLDLSEISHCMLAGGLGKSLQSYCVQKCSGVFQKFTSGLCTYNVKTERQLELERQAVADKIAADRAAEAARERAKQEEVARLVREQQAREAQRLAEEAARLDAEERAKAEAEAARVREEQRLAYEAELERQRVAYEAELARIAAEQEAERLRIQREEEERVRRAEEEKAAYEAALAHAAEEARQQEERERAAREAAEQQAELERRIAAEEARLFAEEEAARLAEEARLAAELDRAAAEREQAAAAEAKRVAEAKAAADEEARVKAEEDAMPAWKRKAAQLARQTAAAAAKAAEVTVTHSKIAAKNIGESKFGQDVGALGGKIADASRPHLQNIADVSRPHLQAAGQTLYNVGQQVVVGTGHVITSLSSPSLEDRKFARLAHGAVVSLNSKASGKNLRILGTNVVDGLGGKGQQAKFIVHRQGTTCRLQNLKHGLKFLKVQTDGELGVGDGKTTDCLFEIEQIVGTQVFTFKKVGYNAHIGVTPNGRAKNAFKTGNGAHGRFAVTKHN